MKHGRGVKRSHRDLCPDIEISRIGVVYFPWDSEKARRERERVYTYEKKKKNIKR